VGPQQLEARRAFFAHLVTANAVVSDRRVPDAFAATPSERSVGPGPWRVYTPLGYIDTPSADPSFLYQNITIALESEGSINNGQPTLHAFCLAALKLQQGDTIVHIGAGTGHYTALLANLTGPTGVIEAFEIEPRLAERAAANLADLENVKVHSRSGSGAPLPSCAALIPCSRPASCAAHYSFLAPEPAIEPSPTSCPRHSSARISRPCALSDDIPRPTIPAGWKAPAGGCRQRRTNERAAKTMSPISRKTRLPFCGEQIAL